MKIELLEEFLTGHPTIDNEHRKIVMAINDVKTAINSNNYDQCAVLLEGFLKTCEKHFKTEERLLANLEYPDLKDHVIFHKELMLKAKAVKVLCIDMSAPQSIERCFDEMAALLIEDVIKGDMNFISFLIEKGVVERRNSAQPIIKNEKNIPKILSPE